MSYPVMTFSPSSQTGSKSEVAGQSIEILYTIRSLWVKGHALIFGNSEIIHEMSHAF